MAVFEAIKAVFYGYAHEFTKIGMVVLFPLWLAITLILGVASVVELVFIDSIVLLVELCSKDRNMRERIREIRGL